MDFDGQSESSSAKLRRLMEMQSAVYSFLTGLLPNDADIDIVMQEVKMVVWKAAQEDTIKNFDAFVYGVARNKAKSCLRKIGRSRLVLCDDDLLQSLSDRWMSQASQSEPTSHRQHALRKCMGRLKEQDKQRMEAYYKEDTPLREIARREGRSEAALHQIFHRLRVKLRTCIEQTLQPEGGLG